MTVKTEFEVTEKAGYFVAGRRSPGKGRKILLTEDEAHFALVAGELKRPGAKTPGPMSRKKEGKVDPPAVDQAQDEANPPVDDPVLVAE